MNDKDRRLINTLIDELTSIKDQIEVLATDLMNRHDNLPESFQEGEQGTRTYEQSEELDAISADLEDIISRLDEQREGGG